MSRSLHFKVLVDLPKEIRDRRKAQWPKLKKAREEGKTGYLSWREPDKLYIDGVSVRSVVNDGQYIYLGLDVEYFNITLSLTLSSEDKQSFIYI